LAAAAHGGEAQPPARPTDKVKLKLVLTHIAHKHYEAAIRVTREMLDGNPGDPEALLWQALACARLALQRGDDDAAFTYYEQILRIDPEHREAREFVRAQQRDKKLNSLPFGRYFTHKKK
jgi:tetratricopeptide (TPR) repeat protein